MLHKRENKLLPTQNVKELFPFEGDHFKSSVLQTMKRVKPTRCYAMVH
jgi:hypothetical protein